MTDLNFHNLFHWGKIKSLQGHVQFQGFGYVELAIDIAADHRQLHNYESKKYCLNNHSDADKHLRLFIKNKCIAVS